jgi:hypothetical protein
VLHIFVPAIRELQKRVRKKDFDLHLSINMATEYLHLVHPEGLTPEQIEARDWPIVVKEMIRPALKLGWPVAPIYSYIDRMFQAVNDDPTDPRWITAFNHYFDFR